MSQEFLLFVSKLAPLAGLPEGLLVVALLGVCFSAWRRAYRAARIFGVMALAIYWTGATPVVANWLMSTLERQHPAAPATLPRAEVGIVLGGAVQAPVPPRVEPELGEAADRVWHAAQLYRSGHIKKIVVVGGNLPWSRAAVPEAELIRSLLIGLGVPATSILIGSTSRNTFENAIEARSIMQGRPFESALLITSAAHMPRALATFRQAGIPIEPAPCDFRTSDTMGETVLDWLPQARSFAVTNEALREWLGFHVYRWRGWL